MSHTLFFLGLSLLLAGCTPPGPRALLEGKRLIEQGQYELAVEKLRVATSILATNAQAWNYLGLACHRAGQATNAVAAYKRAVLLNPDLTEAHYNLGCLWLEQNRLDEAKAELTAYTLRRPSVVEGWLKLAGICLRQRDLAGAERHFNDALRLSAQLPEALNGLGLVFIQRNRPREAAQYFSSALKQRPQYAAAMLNLATVSHRYLNDRTTSLQLYRSYLDLKPTPANAEAVRGIVNALELPVATTPRPAPGTGAASPATTPDTARPPAPANNARSSVPKAEPPAVVTRAPVNVVAAPETNIEVVKLPPEPVIRTSPVVATSPPPANPAVTEAASAPSVAPVVTDSSTTPKRNFLQRINPLNLFRGTKSSPKATPPPTGAAAVASDTHAGSESRAATSASASLPTNVAAPVSAPSSPGFPRYLYLMPGRPVDGDRQEATRAFAQGAQAQRAGRLADAAQAYREATRSDPGYFEAYYSLGLVSFQLKIYHQALAAYETALAIKPDSTDARYNFALALKAAGYPLDAANELNRILATNPNETRAHLALGNLYVQPLHDPARARPHYLKVLELEPRHPAATDIRFWLEANSP